MPLQLVTQVATRQGYNQIRLLSDGNLYQISDPNSVPLFPISRLRKIGFSDSAWSLPFSSGNSFTDCPQSLPQIGDTLYAVGFASGAGPFYNWTLGDADWNFLGFTPNVDPAPEKSFLAMGGNVYIYGPDGATWHIYRWNGAVWSTFFTAGSGHASNGSIMFALNGTIYLLQPTTGVIYGTAGGVPAVLTAAAWNNGGLTLSSPIASPDAFVTVRSGVAYVRNLSAGDTLHNGSFFSWDGVAASMTALVPWAGEQGHQTGIALWNGSLYTGSRVGNQLLRYDEAGGFEVVFTDEQPVNVYGEAFSASRLYLPSAYGSDRGTQYLEDVPAPSSSRGMMPTFIPGI